MCSGLSCFNLISFQFGYFENAVSSVSRLYLEELAVRREQVVASALAIKIRNMQTAVSLLTENDLSVLVIDDDPVVCEHNKLVLEEAGIYCKTVLSGSEAIELVRVRQARHNSYDLILVDLKMPEMDGLEATTHIRVLFVCHCRSLHELVL